MVLYRRGGASGGLQRLAELEGHDATISALHFAGGGDAGACSAGAEACLPHLARAACAVYQAPPLPALLLPLLQTRAAW